MVCTTDVEGPADQKTTGPPEQHSDGAADDTDHHPDEAASQSGGSSYDVRSLGGPRGYERTDDRGPKEYFAAICTSCGNQAQVPFKPRMDRPVYCSDCFREVKPD